MIFHICVTKKLFTDFLIDGSGNNDIFHRFKSIRPQENHRILSNTRFHRSPADVKPLCQTKLGNIIWEYVLIFFRDVLRI